MTKVKAVKTTKIEVRLTVEQKALIKKAAKQHGINVSKYLLLKVL